MILSLSLVSVLPQGSEQKMLGNFGSRSYTSSLVCQIIHPRHLLCASPGPSVGSTEMPKALMHTQSFQFGVRKMALSVTAALGNLSRSQRKAREASWRRSLFPGLWRMGGTESRN